MTLATVKSYILTAASSSLADIVDALATHFTAAPGYWQIAAGVTREAGESLCIELKSPHAGLVTVDPHVVLRVETSSMRVLCDPSKLVTNAGDETTAPTTTSTDDSGEASTAKPVTLSDKILISELGDAIFILLVDAGKTYTPWGVGAGALHQPLTTAHVAVGADGLGLVSGTPRISSGAIGNAWLSSAGGGLIKAGSVSSAWVAAATQNNLAGAGEWSPADDAVLSKIPIGWLIEAQDLPDGGDVVVAMSKYIVEHPDDTQAPLNTAVNGDHSWLFINYTATATLQLIPWETAVLVTL